MLLILKESILTRAADEKQVIVYADENGAEPFSDWIENLKDVMGRK